MVEIPVEYILFLVGSLFIPLFIYLMKNINEQSTQKADAAVFRKHIEDTKDYFVRMSNAEHEIDIIKKSIHDLEEDVKSLFKRRPSDNNNLGGDHGY